MTWFLKSDDGKQVYSARTGEELYLLQGRSSLILTDEPDNEEIILGSLVAYTSGVKLEACNSDLIITPGSSALVPQARGHRGTARSVQNIVLKEKTDIYVETIVLRHLDRISSADKSGTLTLEWNPPQVQVQSSEQNSEASVTPGEADEPEEETEDDDEDLDNTVAPGTSKSQTLRSTPHASISRSEVVQETPTANRLGDFTGLLSRTGRSGTNVDVSTVTDPVYSTAPQTQGDDGITIPKGTADTEMDDDIEEKPEERPEEQPKDSEAAPQRPRHSKAKVSNSAKRQSPAVEETVDSTPRRTSKRRKVDDKTDDEKKVHDGKIDEDSDAEVAPIQTARKTATKSRRRTTTATQTESPHIQSPHSTPASTAGVIQPDDPQEGDYTGPKPRVALSTSTIQPNSHFIKFLKKHGGHHVENIVGDCNILCIKEGPILKTPKILLAIAYGIPIVTDKWLITSTLQTRLLPLEPFAPPALTAVWRLPQSHLFKGLTIFFTPALKTQFRTTFGDMEKLCKAVGARRVVSKKPAAKDVAAARETVFLGVEKGDADVGVLREGGCAVFTKEFLTMGILRGEFDVEGEEFRAVDEPEEESKGKAKAPAKKRGQTRTG